MIKIEIPLLCRSKKNSQQIFVNKRTNKRFVTQSDLYKQFENDCFYFLPRLKEPINRPVNLKCTFYVDTRRKRDLVNLLNAIQDILVKYGVIADDNSDIVVGVDGSRVIYRKNEPATIIEITEYEEDL